MARGTTKWQSLLKTDLHVKRLNSLKNKSISAAGPQIETKTRVDFCSFRKYENESMKSL